MGSSPLVQVQIYNMLQTHVVLSLWKSLETVFLNAICRQSGVNGNKKKSSDKWQSKTLYPKIFIYVRR